MKARLPAIMPYIFLLLFFGINTLYWLTARDVKPVWANVPPVPSYNTALAFALGDGQLAYRSYAFMLQNLGDSGGQSEMLVNYDYDRLGEWFMLIHRLDPVSDFMPLLAAFYYGSTPAAHDLDPVIDYLVKVGESTEGEKWRWLAQAVYLARFRQQDLDQALQLSYMLNDHPKKGRPAWSYQMPAFVLNDLGEKEAAHDLLIKLLIDRVDELDPAEVNFTKEYICDRILTKTEKRQHPLCGGVKSKKEIEYPQSD